MIESLAARLAEPGGPHHGAPDKTPERRLATLEAAGEARVPFTTGILVGIGETRAERIDALWAIRESHERHGHVQEVIVQNFLPKPGTAMHTHAPCPGDEMLWTVAAARIVLGARMHLQAPPNLSDDLAALVGAGIDDWGGVSPVTPDHVNPERPWPALERLRAATEAAGKVLAPRLTVYPEYVVDAPTWLAPEVRFPVWCASDSEGLARDDRWAAGGNELPPRLLPPPVPSRAGGPVGEVLDGVLHGAEPGVDEIVTLLGCARPGGVEGRGGRRPAAARHRRRRRDVRAEPQHQLHERLHVQVQVLRVLEGPAVAQPARHPVPARARGGAAARRRGGRVRRDRGVPAGRDPPRLRRRLLPVGRAGREGGRARHPRARLHRARGDRGRTPPGHAAARLPDPGQGSRPRDAARHRRRDPRRRGPRGHLPRQDHDRRVARGAPHGPFGRAALEHHDHVRARRATGTRRPPHRAHARAPGRDGRLHRVRPAAVRPHGDADLPAATGAPRPHVPRGAPHARRRPHRVPRRHRQHPGVVGQGRRRRRDASCCRPAATTSAAR